MNKLLLGAMNNNRRYNRPFQLQVNVPSSIGILRDAYSKRTTDGQRFVRAEQIILWINGQFAALLEQVR